MRLETLKDLFEGLCEEDMTHLPEISSYNHNYYQINNKLLFAESDDDNYTGWYWVRGSTIVAVGGSYCSDDLGIIVDEAYR